MKAKGLLYYGPHDVRLENLRVPTPKSTDVLVNIKYSTICGSDVTIWNSGLLIKKDLYYPVLMGHEAFGEIVKLGEKVTTDVEGKPLKIGDPVILSNIIGCGKCIFCKRGKTNLCPERKNTGITCPGTFVEYWTYPKQIVHKAEGLTPAQGALVEPASVAFHGVTLSNVFPGDNVLVYGAGPIGLFVTQLLRLKGAGKIVVSELYEHKRNLARYYGADIVINSQEDSVIELAKKETELGFDVIIEAVGLTSLLKEAIEVVRNGGTIVVIGVAHDAGGLSVDDIRKIRSKEIHITGSAGYTIWGLCHDFTTIIKFMRDGKLKIDQMITHEFPLDDYYQAFQQASKPNESIKVAFNLCE